MRGAQTRPVLRRKAAESQRFLPPLLQTLLDFRTLWLPALSSETGRTLSRQFVELVRSLVLPAATLPAYLTNSRLQYPPKAHRAVASGQLLGGVM